MKNFKKLDKTTKVGLSEALKMYKNSIGENEVWQYDTINKIDKITEYLKNN